MQHTKIKKINKHEAFLILSSHHYIPEPVFLFLLFQEAKAPHKLEPMFRGVMVTLLETGLDSVATLVNQKIPSH